MSRGLEKKEERIEKDCHYYLLHAKILAIEFFALVAQR